MLLIPDPKTANIDPFTAETTLILTCDVIDPADGKGYERDPRHGAPRGSIFEINRHRRHGVFWSNQKFYF